MATRRDDDYPMVLKPGDQFGLFENKKRLQMEIDDQVKKFLAKGGVIEKCPIRIGSIEEIKYNGANVLKRVSNYAYRLSVEKKKSQATWRKAMNSERIKRETEID